MPGLKNRNENSENNTIKKNVKREATAYSLSREGNNIAPNLF